MLGDLTSVGYDRHGVKTALPTVPIQDAFRLTLFRTWKTSDLLDDPLPLHVLKPNHSVARFSLSAFLQIWVISTESICQRTSCRSEVLDDVTNKFLSSIHCCMWQDEVPGIVMSSRWIALQNPCCSLMIDETWHSFRGGILENNGTWTTTIMTKIPPAPCSCFEKCDKTVSSAKAFNSTEGPSNI